MRKRIRLHWFKKRQPILDADPAKRWRSVTGPLSTTISYLCDLAWCPVGPDSWTDASGQQWSMRHLTTEHIEVKSTPLIQAVQKAALRWVEARTSWLPVYGA